MKIEKINDNQIRCTLTSDDLASREIKLSELAYGTEKAKNLFQDMMRQAQSEFGFDSDNSPLMVEAIPVSPDSVVLIITKVDDPEELDTRFSKFAPDGNTPSAPAGQPHITGADDIIEVFHKLSDAKKKLQEIQREKKTAGKTEKKPGGQVSKAEDEVSVNLLQSFLFSDLDTVIRASHGLAGFFDGKNSLYKNRRKDRYQLILHQSDYSPEDFNKACNILSEYGSGSNFTPAGEAYLKEHEEMIIADHALQRLIQL